MRPTGILHVLARLPEKLEFETLVVESITFLVLKEELSIYLKNLICFFFIKSIFRDICLFNVAENLVFCHRLNYHYTNTCTSKYQILKSKFLHRWATEAF